MNNFHMPTMSQLEKFFGYLAPTLHFWRSQKEFTNLNLVEKHPSLVLKWTFFLKGRICLL